jgi:hypothetical protein
MKNCDHERPTITCDHSGLQSACNTPGSTGREPGVCSARGEEGPHIAAELVQESDKLLASPDSQRTKMNFVIKGWVGIFGTGPCTKKAWRRTPVRKHDRFPPLLLVARFG